LRMRRSWWINHRLCLLIIDKNPGFDDKYFFKIIKFSTKISKE